MRASPDGGPMAPGHRLGCLALIAREEVQQFDIKLA